MTRPRATRPAPPTSHARIIAWATEEARPMSRRTAAIWQALAARSPSAEADVGRPNAIRGPRRGVGERVCVLNKAGGGGGAAEVVREVDRGGVRRTEIGGKGTAGGAARPLAVIRMVDGALLAALARANVSLRGPKGFYPAPLKS